MRNSPSPQPDALSLVERGWRASRECTLALARRGVRVTQLLKGSVDADILGLIQPHPQIRLHPVPRALFRPLAWLLLMLRSPRRRLRWVLMDHERTARDLQTACRRLGITPVWVAETDTGYALHIDGRPCSLDELLGS